MSTVIVGETDTVFDSMKAAFQSAAALGTTSPSTGAAAG